MKSVMLIAGSLTLCIIAASVYYVYQSERNAIRGAFHDGLSQIGLAVGSYREESGIIRLVEEKNFTIVVNVKIMPDKNKMGHIVAEIQAIPGLKDCNIQFIGNPEFDSF
jgi:hypothetical protein